LIQLKETINGQFLGSIYARINLQKTEEEDDIAIATDRRDDHAAVWPGVL